MKTSQRLRELASLPYNDFVSKEWAEACIRFSAKENKEEDNCINTKENK